MAVCRACGTENRDKARFCMGCAKALVPVTDAVDAASAAPVVSSVRPMQACPVCQAANPLAATVCQSCRGSLVPDLAKPVQAARPPASRGTALKVVTLLALCLAVAGWWFGLKDGAGSPNDQSLAAAELPVSASRTASPGVQPVSVGSALALSASTAPDAAVSPAAASPVQRAQDDAAAAQARAQRNAAAQARRDQLARERAAAEEQARSARAIEQQRADELRRQRAAETAAQQARAALPAPAPVVRTVEQTCASSGNFISREVCRLRSCGDAANASDPVCVRFREMEETNRRAVTN